MRLSCCSWRLSRPIMSMVISSSTAKTSVEQVVAEIAAHPWLRNKSGNGS